MKGTLSLSLHFLLHADSSNFLRLLLYLYFLTSIYGFIYTYFLLLSVLLLLLLIFCTLLSNIIVRALTRTACPDPAAHGVVLVRGQ